MSEQNSMKRADPMGLLVIIAVVAVLLGGTWMIQKSVAAEGDAIRARIDAVSRQSSAETQELRTKMEALKAEISGSSQQQVASKSIAKTEQTKVAEAQPSSEETEE